MRGGAGFQNAASAKQTNAKTSKISVIIIALYSRRREFQRLTVCEDWREWQN